jgi:hypothetical protein
MGLKQFIQEDAVALFSGTLLQWQRNQISETAFWQSVLVGEKTVV